LQEKQMSNGLITIFVYVINDIKLARQSFGERVNFPYGKM